MTYDERCAKTTRAATRIEYEVGVSLVGLFAGCSWCRIISVRWADGQTDKQGNLVSQDPGLERKEGKLGKLAG